jgi:hypothetical protein
MTMKIIPGNVGTLTTAGLLLAFCVSASAVTLTPAPTVSQIVNYTQGAPTIISERKSIASITVYPEANGHVVLFVAGRNQSMGNINFGTENIRADANGKPLRVFTYDELAKKINSTAFWKRFAGAAGAGLRSGAAVQPAQTNYGGTFNGYGYGNGPYYGSYQGHATTIDPAQQALAQSAINSDARRQGAALNAQQNQSLAALRVVLRTTTVQPGQMYGGVVEIARPPVSSIMNVRASFAGEAHIFSFRVAR